MTDPNDIPRTWKLGLVALLLALVLAALALIAWGLVRLGSTCESEGHLADLCEPYQPGVPGKEGR